MESKGGLQIEVIAPLSQPVQKSPDWHGKPTSGKKVKNRNKLSIEERMGGKQIWMTGLQSISQVSGY